MSMSYCLYPSVARKPAGIFYGEVVLELDKNTRFDGSVLAKAVPITLPVRVQWASGCPETRVPDEIDTDCTWLLSAGDLHGTTLYGPHWHPDRRIKMRAVAAYLAELPADWPVIVHYV